MENTNLIGIIFYSSFLIPLLLTGFLIFKTNLVDSFKKLYFSFVLFITYIVGIFLIGTILGLKNNLTFLEFFNELDFRKYIFLIPLFIFIGFFHYYSIRLLIGKIKIKLFGNNFISGDKINGEINLKINKKISGGKLIVYLRGYRLVVKTNKSSSTKELSYEDYLILEENINTDIGFIKDYSFSFDVGYLDDNDNNIEKLFNITKRKKGYNYNKQEEEIAYRYARQAYNLVGNFSGYNQIKFWKIEVVLEKKGVDLYESIPVKINRVNKK